MKKNILVAGILFSSLFSVAQVDRSERPTAGTAPQININDSEVFTTSNGITVILSENHKLPKVSIRLVTGSDPMQEGPKAGLSTVAGQLIMSGTAKRSKDQLDNEIDYIGASLSADATSLSLSCLTKHLPKGLDLMTDVLYNANFPQSEFERIIKQNESGLLSAKSSPDQMANNAVRKINFPNGHPYGEIMTEKSLASITKADVENYFKKVFTPDGAYLVIVGDITKAQATELVEKHFTAWKGDKKYKANLGDGAFGKGNRVIFVKKPGAVQSLVTITFPVKMKPGEANQIPLTVTNGILGGGGFGTRMMQNLREDKAYTYGCYSRIEFTDNGSWFTVSGNFRNEVTDSAITQILFELDRITNEYVKDDELNLTKSSMAGGFARSLESPSTIARFALNIIQNNLPKDYYKTYLKKLAAVDKEAVLLMAQTYLTAKNCNIIVVGNEEILEKLKQFDADGKIELVDAFGNPVQDMKKADISKEDLIEKYILTNTLSSNMKEAQKKIAKVKSVKQVMELKTQQVPAALTMTSYFVAPNKESMKLEMQGMLLQKQYFDGKTGGSMNMQTGKKDLTAEEIEKKQKGGGLFPEMNFAKNGINHELLGIENQNGTDMYVLKIVEGENTTFEYFDTKNFQKLKTVSIAKQDGQVVETSRTYSDYKEVKGLLFPHSNTLMMGEIGLNGKTISIEINGKVDAGAFQ
jgi:zinc protease